LIRNGFTKPPWFFVVPMVFGWRAGIVSGRLNGARSTHMGYTPRPIDTTGVTVDADLLALTERLAEHSHDTWAQQRISEGWTYGPRRDDAAKQHPDLIPYAELPESEKEYDRQAALGTIRAMIALGYRIVRGQPVSR
jgi:hypothetical protein